MPVNVKKKRKEEEDERKIYAKMRKEKEKIRKKECTEVKNFLKKNRGKAHTVQEIEGKLPNIPKVKDCLDNSKFEYKLGKIDDSYYWTETRIVEIWGLLWEIGSILFLLFLLYLVLSFFIWIGGMVT